METFTHLIQQYGLLAIFVSVLIESTGLPIPSYPILMVAAALAPGMKSQLAEILLVGVCGDMIPDFCWFFTGRRYGMRVLGIMCRLSLTPDTCVKNTSTIFMKVGPPSLGITKFIPGVGNVAIVLAGIVSVPLALFAAFDFIGSVLYIGVAVALGAIFHDAVADVIATLVNYGRWGIAAVAAALALYLLLKWAQRYLLIRQLRMDRITVEELRTLIDGGQPPTILDVRPARVRAIQGYIPGSIFAEVENIDVVIRDLPTDREVVVYCSCPNEYSAASLARKLKKAGLMKIRPLRGGIEAWRRAGMTVEVIDLAA
jgi:membrane protein DedA with SNARE-associated domain/rhodanese-related sulfurtransferase